MSDHQMIGMPHSQYSPDLASSDFYLFGIVKNRLERIQASDMDEFLEQLYELLHSIPVEELEHVFSSWIDRVRQISEGIWHYIT
jgi:hypothetical protein